MKLIPLSGKRGMGKFVQVDDEDYERVKQFKWYCDRDYAMRKPYIKGSGRKNQKCELIQMHRFIMGLTDSKIHIDHKDGNRLNNQRANLRFANQAQNAKNQKTRKNNTSGFKGVSWNKRDKKWEAYIKFNYKRIYLGYFKTKEVAALAYDKKAKELFGEFSRLNF